MSLFLHVLTDTSLQKRYSHFELARYALAGGADVIQYRQKSILTEADKNEILKIYKLKQEYSFSLLLNDWAEEAAILGLDGCHVGKEDESPARVRELFALENNLTPIIGATVHSLEELEALKGQTLSYIGVGPVFGTQSKNTGLPALGLEKLAEICTYSPFPVVGIGNITPEKVPALLKAGVRGIAVLGAVCMASDPEEAVKSFAQYFH